MIDLFHQDTSIANLLPFDGEVYYFGKIVNKIESSRFFDILFASIQWQQDEIRIAGKTIITKRKVAWYASKPYTYVYSGSAKTASIWTPELLELKTIAEMHCNTSYNSCLLNLYHSGQEGVTWHSDNESSIQNTSSIASFSFGAERQFVFKHKLSKEKVACVLENGSLLNMTGCTQKNWLHSLPKTKKVTTPRINLTFRTMIG